jgi:ATP-dependent Lon protease
MTQQADAQYYDDDLDLPETPERRLEAFDELLFGLMGSAPHDVPVYDNWDVDFALGSLVQLPSVRNKTSARKNEGIEEAIRALPKDEQIRAILLSRMMARGCFREGIVATDVTLEAVRAVGAKHPQFGDYVEMVLGKLAISKFTKTPVAIPPSLLVGPPGVGKTHFAHDLATALQVPSKVVTASSSYDLSGSMMGLSPYFTRSRMGHIARMLIEGDSASPMIILDEADKARTNNGLHGLDWAHEAFEANNAQRLIDEYLEVSIDASRVIWLLLANSAHELPESIRDRLMIFEIKDLSADHRRTVIQSVAADVMKRLNIPAEAAPSKDLLELLEKLSPRQARQVLEMSYSKAALGGSLTLTPAIVRASVILIREREEIGVRTIGMTPRRRNPD